MWDFDWPATPGTHVSPGAGLLDPRLGRGAPHPPWPPSGLSLPGVLVNESQDHRDRCQGLPPAVKQAPESRCAFLDSSRCRGQPPPCTPEKLNRPRMGGLSWEPLNSPPTAWKASASWGPVWLPLSWDEVSRVLLCAAAWGRQGPCRPRRARAPLPAVFAERLRLSVWLQADTGLFSAPCGSQRPR